MEYWQMNMCGETRNDTICCRSISQKQCPQEMDTTVVPTPVPAHTSMQQMATTPAPIAVPTSSLRGGNTNKLLEECSTTVEGEECYSAVLWAKNYGIAQHPEWYDGLTHHSTFEEFQAKLSSWGRFSCKRPCDLCHTAMEGERCHEEVRWAMLHGIRKHPEWYAGLTSGASFQEFQSNLHHGSHSSCPKPCDLCRTVVEGDKCYTDVAWAMDYGIDLHPEWYVGLNKNSTKAEFQAFLSKQFDCPRACGLCHTAVAGEPCHDGVMWARRQGIKLHPEWYPDLSPDSSFEAFQEHLHQGLLANCPKPCSAPN